MAWLSHVIKIPTSEAIQKNPTISNELAYKQYRNKLKSLLQKTEKSFYCEKIRLCNNDLKQVWSVIGKLIGCNQKQSPSSLLCDGSVVTDPKRIVE